MFSKINLRKKMAVISFCVTLVLQMSNLTVLAASPKELVNTYKSGIPSYASATVYADKSISSDNNKLNLSAVTSSTVTQHSSVTSSYGIITGCSLNGICWCTTESGSKTESSFSASTVFYHSNGDQLISSTASGNSSSSSDFTWKRYDDSDETSYYTASTSTTTICTKSGYNTVTLYNSSTNPYH